MAARARPFFGRRGQREVFGHRPAVGRAIGVEVLQGHQERVVALGGSQDAAL